MRGHGNWSDSAAASAAMLDWWIILCRRASIVSGPGELYFSGSLPISSRSFGFSISFVVVVVAVAIVPILYIYLIFSPKKIFIYIIIIKIIIQNSIYIYRVFFTLPISVLYVFFGPQGPPLHSLLSPMT